MESELHVDYSRGEKSRALVRREVGREALMEADLERARTVVGRGEKRGLLPVPTTRRRRRMGRTREKTREAR